MTKFPGYKIRFMDDSQGNMNEIVSDEYISDTMKEGNKYNYIFLTIEEACEYQKQHPKKVIAICDYDPQEIVDYIKNSGAKYV